MSKLNEAQRKAKDYVDEHWIEKIVSEMINSLVHTKDKKPLIFMVSTLNRLDQVPFKSCNKRRAWTKWNLSWGALPSKSSIDELSRIWRGLPIITKEMFEQGNLVKNEKAGYTSWGENSAMHSMRSS